jgi:uncharacterized cupin superfamily protein
VRKINLASVELVWDEGDPEGYRAGMARFGPSIGASKLGGSVYELPPGESICPYHYEYPEEEWLVVLQGRPTLRHPGGEDKVEEGDVICFPEGPEGAHKVTNDTDETVRVLMLSTKHPTAAAVYPDSDKIGIWTGNKDDHVLVRRESHVGYYEGEV